MIPRMKFAARSGLIQSCFREVSHGKTFCGFYLILILAALCLPVSGCSKKSKTEAQNVAPVEGSQNAPLPETQNPAANSKPASSPVSPQPLPASSQTIPADASVEAVTGQLTSELRRYIAYTRSIPKSFEDFAAHDPIKFPPPPAGKKYVITGGKVVVQ